jgi:hypothetical protein
MNRRDIGVITVCIIGLFILWISYIMGYDYYTFIRPFVRWIYDMTGHDYDTLRYIMLGIGALTSAIILLVIYILIGGVRR